MADKPEKADPPHVSNRGARRAAEKEAKRKQKGRKPGQQENTQEDVVSDYVSLAETEPPPSFLQASGIIWKEIWLAIVASREPNPEVVAFAEREFDRIKEEWRRTPGRIFGEAAQNAISAKRAVGDTFDEEFRRLYLSAVQAIASPPEHISGHFQEIFRKGSDSILAMLKVPSDVMNSQTALMVSATSAVLLSAAVVDYLSIRGTGDLAMEPPSSASERSSFNSLLRSSAYYGSAMAAAATVIRSFPGDEHVSPVLAQVPKREESQVSTDGGLSADTVRILSEHLNSVLNFTKNEQSD